MDGLDGAECGGRACVCARACVHAPVCTRVCIFRPQSLPSSCRGFLRTAQSTTKEVLPTAKPNAPCCAPRPSVWMHTCRAASARQSPCSSPLCPREGSLERTSRSALGESTRHPELMLINQQLILNRHPNCSSPLNAYHTRVPDTPLLASVNPRGSSAPLSPQGLPAVWSTCPQTLSCPVWSAGQRAGWEASTAERHAYYFRTSALLN